MNIGDKVKIKSYPFIVKELHEQTGEVIRTQSFTDHTNGKLYDMNYIKLDHLVKLGGCSWIMEQVNFTSDCLEKI
jgi:hypothetical protein